MPHIKTIEPCPEKFGWDVIPPEDYTVYFEVDEYGYVAIIIHPLIEAAYLHAMPYKKIPKLNAIKAAVAEFERRLIEGGVKLFICNYETPPKDTVFKLITKHLNFIPITKTVYIKILEKKLDN